MNKLINLFRQVFKAKSEPSPSPLQREVESMAAAAVHIDRELLDIADPEFRQRVINDGYYYHRAYHGLTNGVYFIGTPANLTEYIEKLKKVGSLLPDEKTISNVRRIVLVEFMIKDFTHHDKAYWEGDSEMFEDVKHWQYNSPLHRVKYID